MNMKSIFAMTVALLSLTAFAADAPVAEAKCQKPGEQWVSKNGVSMLYCSQAGFWRDKTKAPAVAFDVVVTKGGDLVTKATVQALDGDSAPVSVTKETAYTKEISRDKDGKLVLVPGAITTGFVLILTPGVQDDGQIKTDVNLSVTDLLGLKKVPTADGIEIERPEVDGGGMKQTLIFKSGQTITQNVGKFTVRITANRV